MSSKHKVGWTAESREDVVRLVQSAQTEIAGRLRSARVTAKMTLDQVAERLFMSKAAVGHWETGNRAIGIGELKLLAALYDTELDYLLGEAEEPLSPEAIEVAKWFENLDADERARLPALAKVLTEKPVESPEVEEKMPATKARRLSNQAIRRAKGEPDN